MILPLIYLNPITFLKETINIEYPEYTYNEYCALRYCKDDDEVCDYLNYKLEFIDTSRLYNGKQIIRTDYPVYKMLLSEYFFFLIKIRNIWLYNMYVIALIRQHEANLLYEYLNKPINKEKKIIRKSVANKYVKYTTKDLFTGENIYVYTNHKTGDEITSNNPNLLEELNAKKKKTKKTKIVPAMTFKFKMN